ncbi:MAG: hypothetical protein KDK08_13345 [Rhizobiaceae bacterium]|nr:hypothetical protein [Rhizobiaceae bacterium]
MTEELKTYLGNRQSDALLIESLLSTAMACAGSGRQDMMLDLIDSAHDAASKLNNDLDSASLPKGSAA